MVCRGRRWSTVKGSVLVGGGWHMVSSVVRDFDLRLRVDGLGS